MKQIDHRKITKEVAERIAPTTDLSLLIAASGEHPDLEREGSCSHHSTQNLKQVESRIRRARREFLQQPFSREFQVSLGIALHYIQDLFTIAVPDRSIQVTSLQELHKDIEAKFPIYTRSVPYEVLDSELLEGADEVLSFVRESIEPVVSSPQHVLSDPGKALDRCFETCLSVAKAVCENEKGFSKGSEAIEVSDGIEQLMKRIGERLDEMPETVKETVRQTQKYLLTTEVKQGAYRWRRRASVHKEEYPDAPLKSHLRTLSDIEEWERDLSENVSRLNEIIESGYEQDYKTRQDNLGWYGLKRTEFKRDFKTVQELNELVQRANEALSQAEAKRTGLESRIQGEMARIDTMLLEKQIENLLDCGRMGLEGHYYEEAHKCFKQVLELDTSNQEAIDGLARIDEISSRRTAAPVEPIQVERVEPPHKIEPKMENRIEELLALGRKDLDAGYPQYARIYFEKALALNRSSQEAIEGLEQVDKALEHKAFFESLEAPARPVSRDRSIIGWIRKKREARAREVARVREEIARQEKQRAEEVAKLKQAWAEKRMQRGDTPLQLGQCPECGSRDSNKYKDVSGLGCLAMILTFPISLIIYPLLPDGYRCKVCGAKWKG